jgi:hypothetical protein
MRLVRFASLYLLCNILIAFTGTIVRVSKSGLGCKNWPNCTSSSFFPRGGIHALIEFGNRGITVLLLAVLLYFLVLVRRKKELMKLALIELLLLLSQALLGGLSVISSLNKILILFHFLFSILSIDLAVYVLYRSIALCSDIKTKKRFRTLFWSFKISFSKMVFAPTKSVEKEREELKASQLNEASYPITFFSNEKRYWLVSTVLIHLQAVWGTFVSRSGEWTGAEGGEKNQTFLLFLAVHAVLAIVVLILSKREFALFVAIQMVIGFLSYISPLFLPFHVLIAVLLLSTYLYNFLLSE